MRGLYGVEERVMRCVYKVTQRYRTSVDIQSEGWCDVSPLVTYTGASKPLTMPRSPFNKRYLTWLRVV